MTKRQTPKKPEVNKTISDALTTCSQAFEAALCAECMALLMATGGITTADVERLARRMVCPHWELAVFVETEKEKRKRAAKAKRSSAKQSNQPGA